VAGQPAETTSVPRTLEESYDAAVAHALPLVAGVLAAVYLGLSGWHLLLLGGSDRLVLVALTSASAVVFGLVLLVSRRPDVERLAHPLGAGVALLVVANTVTAMVLTEEPRQTTTVMLVLVGAGATLLSLRWLAAVGYLAWGSWALGGFLVGAMPQWPHYLVAMSAATLLAAVINHVRRRTVAELAAARQEVDAAAVRDHLSGLANRRGLAMVGGTMVEQARRQGDAVHCIFVDIDGLKDVNDRAGHSAGDEVIVCVSDAMRAVTRATDVVARWGGDEFCLVGPGPGMAPMELERRVREYVLRHPPVPEAVWPARVSAGGAMLAPWDSGTLDTLLGKADQEMYLRRSLRREGAARATRPASAD
jgi:diguanylate cyclase (GGDEF)-like protein